jgi:nicotinate-nucleotide pyrophosphorylase (carboxylating)
VILEHRNRAAKALIKQAFEEDLGQRGDITTRALATSSQSVSASIIAKQNGVICGLEIVRDVFVYIDPSVRLDFSARDGDAVQPGQMLVDISGTADKILSAERIALNFLGHLSGIATYTKKFVDAVAGFEAMILDTRKTTPGWRVLEKYAVTCGGGENHRIGLFDMFLIKENHIQAAGSITNAVQRCHEFMQKHQFQAEIEVETQNVDNVKEALSQSVDRILLDNMTPEQMRECVKLVNHRIPLEASGNVSLDTIRAIADTGVNFISIGALTHSAPSFDVSLLVH